MKTSETRETQLAELRNAQQISTQKQFIVISRIKSEQTRRALDTGDAWSKGCIFFSEKQAQEEFNWLKSHSQIREYILASREKKPEFSEPEKKEENLPEVLINHYDDGLDDIPFSY